MKTIFRFLLVGFLITLPACFTPKAYVHSKVLEYRKAYGTNWNNWPVEKQEEVKKLIAAGN